MTLSVSEIVYIDRYSSFPSFSVSIHFCSKRGNFRCPCHLPTNPRRNRHGQRVDRDVDAQALARRGKCWCRNLAMGKPWETLTQKRCQTAKISQTYLSTIFRIVIVLSTATVDKLIETFGRSQLTPAEGMAPTLPLMLKVGCRPKHLPSRSSGDDEATNAEAPSTPAPKQKASETPGCNSCRHQTCSCCFNMF